MTRYVVHVLIIFSQDFENSEISLSLFAYSFIISLSGVNKKNTNLPYLFESAPQLGERSRCAYGSKYVISSRALFTSVDQFSYFVRGKISSISVSQYLGPLLDLINVKTGRCV